MANPLQVKDAMSGLVVTVGPTHTLRQAAKAMSARRVGAAVILDGDGSGPGILTERDLLDAIAGGSDPDTELVGAHVTTDAVVAGPEWSIDEAGRAMVRGQFRHLIVVDGGEVVGVLSVRDVLTAWTGMSLVGLP
jgi:CBS domain-containing protein